MGRRAGMLVNFHHLRKYVDWQGSVEELCDLLTQLGIEVEGVHAPAPECAGLVVGEVLARDPHPNADRLTLCQVEVGEEAPRQIVCGATNHSVGSKVVVALPGQELAGGMRIEKRAVRGIASEGMMCSAREIGLGEEHEGILLLPEDSVVGAPAFPLLCVVELSITPNRPDLLGWIGLAREIAAATGAEIRAPLSHFNSSAEDPIPIRLEDRKGCPRYLGRVVRDVQVAASPQWLRKAVADLGLSSVNNVVDVTNFVLMEWGQPLHAFDLDRLRGPEICVREAAPGESFVAINHETYTLEADHLVIADKGGAVALAGIMGGEGTEITNHTRNLFIECAYFDPPRIRRGSKSLGLSSDSSFRFERGVDPEALEPVINRCVALILEVAGGRATSGILEACALEHLPKPRKVAVRGARSTEVIGAHLSESTQADILRRLGCEVEEAESGTIEATIPSYRSDLTKEIDLIEEIARHWGYTNIPYTPPEMSTRVTEVHPVFVLNKRIREFLAPRGWAETKSYSFAHSDCSDRLLLCASSPFRQGIRVQNPISAETETLRTTLLGSLLDTLEVNTRRGERSLRVFEFGKVYPRGVEGLLGAERHALGLAWLGQAPIHWESRGKVFDFFDAKGTCEALFQALGVMEFQIEPFEVE
ncbi:MAG: phenylalanine--tRNA ligase subunit beta, partial [Candidatus Omnitrophica bacterium]|nr:phenylalanine--tRNA ligase subunit beta [Candidatus Omnitrophota bacterium]